MKLLHFKKDGKKLTIPYSNRQVTHLKIKRDDNCFHIYFR